MPNLKLSRKLFNLQVNSNTSHNKQAISPPPAQSPSPHEPITTQQLPQGHQAQRTDIINFKQSSFLSLPGEVRNLIYSHAIYPSLETITIFHHADTFLSLPIFHVSRQVRHEAVSYLCAEKNLYLSSLNVANDFFGVVGQNGVRSLRHVTVRCENTWHRDSSKARVARDGFLGYLQLAAGLRRFAFVVGRWPFAGEDGVKLECALSSGAGFLYAVRDMVDGVGDIGREVASGDKTDWVYEGAGEGHGVEHLKTKHENGGMCGDVFRLYKANGVEGEVLDLRLPSQLSTG